jgi:hypothetical protein
LNADSNSEVKVKFTGPSNLVNSICASIGCTPDVNDPLITSFNKTTPTFSLDILRINQVTHYVERQEYVLNMFDNMDGVDIDPDEIKITMMY